MSSSTITVFCAITARNGERVPLQLNTMGTSTELRQQAAEVTKIPLDQLRLIFRGKMIKDDDSLAVETYKLEQECVLHCMGKPTESLPSSSSSPSSAAATASPDAAVATTTTTGTGTTTATPVAAAVPSIPTSVSSTSTTAASAEAAVVDPLQAALQMLRTSNSLQVYATAVSTLAKILANIADHPMEEKYRKVKKQNVAFAKKLGGLNGGDAAMMAVGFVLEQQDGAPVYQLYASAEAWPRLMAARAILDAAVVDAERSLSTPPSIPAANASNPFLGMPGMAGLPGADAMNNPAMQSAMAEMMSNPEAMRDMLQNPMVQQMIQNDPSVSPMIRNSMQQLVNNPAMLNQLSTMMSDPAMRDRMQTMMGGAGAGAMPNIMGNAMPPSQSPSRSTNVRNDQDQTEEEMIAEAIRRSLEEN